MTNTTAEPLSPESIITKLCKMVIYGLLVNNLQPIPAPCNVLRK
jgi:hypothetical protein